MQITPERRAFVGRESEIARLRALFDEVLGGTPRTLLVDGEAGIGKTTVIDRFLAELPNARVVRASGEESETGIRFAVVDQLLRAAGVDTIDVLGASQHVAVGMELLERLSAPANEHGTVVVVDDAHLADADSMRALLFCARRLAASATLFVVIVRGAAPEVLTEGWLKIAEGRDGDRLSPRPLTADETRSLARELGVTLAADASARLREHTRGNPLHTRALLRELSGVGNWVHEPRHLPAPRSYAQLIEARVRRCAPDVVALLSAAAVIGVRAPLHAASRLAALDDPLATVDDAIASGLIGLATHGDGTSIEFTHPMTRAAVYDSIPQSRRSSLHAAAASVVESAEAALHHRVEAATLPDAELQTELETAARGHMAQGAWAVAVEHLLAASRIAPLAADRERLALAAIEALMYSGDGGAARRLAERTTVAPGPRRDSIWAYLAMFAGDLDIAEQLLERAWDRRQEAGDDRLAATIAQRSAFLASSRLRGHDAIEWAERATALSPDDTATALLAAPSLAMGLSFAGRTDEAHAVLDRWLGDRGAPAPGSGFVLLALKARLLEGRGELETAAAAFERAAEVSLREGLFVVAAISLAGLARVQYLAGAWDDAIVSGERAVALAIESEDRWVVAHARWSASHVPLARGDSAVAEALALEVAADHASFERHRALQAITAAQLAAAQERPADVLAALSPLERWPQSDGVTDPAFLPWHHLKADALIDTGQFGAAEEFIAQAEALAASRSHRLLAARLSGARGKLAVAREQPVAAVGAFTDALEILEPLGMPYEQALIELSHAQFLRREGQRRATAALLLAARDRLAALSALPALRRCEQELAACGLTPAARSARDYVTLTPQETAVARLVVSGMTNREVSKELMLSTKTVEFHLRHVYLKTEVRSRSELRARARAHELEL